MDFVKKTTLTTIINQYRQKDYTLWQILNSLANANESLRLQFNALRTAFNWEMRIFIPGVLSTGIERGSGYRVTLPRDENGKLIYTKVKLVMVHVSATVIPTGADFIGDVRFSLNQSDFYSIFKTNTTLVLPDDGFTVLMQYTDFAIGQFIDGGLVIVDVSQTGNVNGLEVILLGLLLP